MLDRRRPGSARLPRVEVGRSPEQCSDALLNRSCFVIRHVDLSEDALVARQTVCEIQLAPTFLRLPFRLHLGLAERGYLLLRDRSPIRNVIHMCEVGVSDATPENRPFFMLEVEP